MKTALFLLLATAAIAADAPLLKDDFSAPKLETRRASRGDWNLYRLTLMVGNQSITRPYLAQNGTFAPAGYWVRKE